MNLQKMRIDRQKMPKYSQKMLIEMLNYLQRMLIDSQKMPNYWLQTCKSFQWW